MSRKPVVVVATDLSTPARAGIAQAVRIAGTIGASVQAVTVIEKDEISGMAKASGVARDEAERLVSASVGERLEAECRAAAGADADAIAQRVLVGRATREIVGICEEADASMLVLGYNGWGDEQGGPGRVALSCARLAPCDVLLARAGHPGAFERIAAAVDFSDGSILAARRAALWASRDDAELVLLHAHFNPFASPLLVGSPLKALDMYQDHAASLQRELDDVLGRVGSDGPSRKRAQLLDDVNPARAIATWCKEHNADLMVLGALGRSALRHALMGSTTERILSKSPSAVLVVRED